MDGDAERGRVPGDNKSRASGGGGAPLLVDIDGGGAAYYSHSSFCNGGSGAGTATRGKCKNKEASKGSDGGTGLQGFFRRKLSLSRKGSESNEEWMPPTTTTTTPTNLYQTLLVQYNTWTLTFRQELRKKYHLFKQHNIALINST